MRLNGTVFLEKELASLTELHKGVFIDLHPIDNIVPCFLTLQVKLAMFWSCVGKVKSGIPYWESILCLDSLMNSRLAIIATRNMVENIGMTTDSTHSDTQLEYLTKTEKRLFDIPTFELDFPIKHPPYVVADMEYFRQLDLFFANGHPFITFGRKMYHIFKYTLHGEIFKKISKKFKTH